MVLPRQEIKTDDGHNHFLLIRIYDLERVKSIEIREIADAFKDKFYDLPIDFIKVTINITPLDEYFSSHVIFVKIDESNVIYSSVLAVGKNVASTVKGFLGTFVEKFYDNISNLDLTEPENNDSVPQELRDEHYKNPLGLLLEPINVDDILRDFEDEEKRKKDEGK